MADHSSARLLPGETASSHGNHSLSPLQHTITPLGALNTWCAVAFFLRKVKCSAKPCQKHLFSTQGRDTAQIGVRHEVARVAVRPKGPHSYSRDLVSHS